ncbi:hypothetical protein A3715_04800 [Oleiphilus sp. HI0009]|nr:MULTISPECIES: BatD family protein [unclassified Oleiphilus]KZX83422.1 hypothetical protein A3715_04800 [Oleiphilus sp. HI0009]KZY69830.1 hypothetical protein A3739_07770 [Oleiphilus sp. HI0067]KZY72292.1 hypothetical protein A3738_00005 [Oleiphilus sp. HI0066]
MVKALFHSFMNISFLYLLVMMPNVHAADETTLDISIDKDKLYQNEILNLTVTARAEMGFVGGLMSLGGMQIDAPDFPNLEETWTILDRRQSYNMQSINGKTESLITWRYALSPKSSGSLTIPEASFKDAKSAPVSIEVIAGNRPHSDAQPPSVFLKASIDKPSPYLQEQIIYTLELYTLGEARGDMSEPQNSDFIIEPFGETSKTYKMAYNQRYEVYERRYLLFPQKSGALSLAGPEFTGTVVDSRTRRRARARELANSVEFDVKPPPAEFSGKTWLPASSLALTQSFDPEISTLEVGGSVTRTVTLSALGLLGSALPELAPPSSNALKVYPDTPELDTIEHSAGAQSQRKERHALVAVSPAQAILPALEIKWWDTVNDVERVARLPEQSIDVVAASRLGTEQDLNTPDSSALDQNSEDSSSSSELSALNSEAETTQSTSEQVVSSSSYLWPIAIVLVLISWGAHATWLYRKLRRDNTQQERKPNREQDIYDELIHLIERSDMRYLSLFHTWSRQLDRISSLDQNDAKQIIARLEAAKYSAQHDNESYKQDEKQLLAAVKALHKLSMSGSRSGKSDRYGLKPFYPV